METNLIDSKINSRGNRFPIFFGVEAKFEF